MKPHGTPLTPSAQACEPVFQSVLPVTVLLPERLWVFSPSAAASTCAALSRNQPGKSRMTERYYPKIPEKLVPQDDYATPCEYAGFRQSQLNLTPDICRFSPEVVQTTK
jgi:hypothetical protein